VKAIALRREAATLEGLVDRVLCHDVRDAAGKIAVEKGARLTAATAKILLETPWEEIHLLVVEPSDLHEEEAGKRLAVAIVGDGVEVKGYTGGQWTLAATRRGLLRVRRQALADTNALEGISVFSRGTDAVDLRRRVGMVFQQPNPFPKTIFDNVAYGPRLNGLAPERDVPERVERALRQAALWDEVKDRLQGPGTSLSGGQQQRLCIARALANEPEVLLMDEPCSALDPAATQRIEELMVKLKESYAIVIVTHDMQQASRVSDFTGFFYLGRLVEFGDTKQLFTRPRDERTEAYITGRFG